MKAIVISQFGPPSVLTITDLPTPTPHPGEVLIKIAAFGINHAEMHMRKGEWAEWMPVSGIECVGTVAACPAGEFTPGIRVASLMGGLGRTVNGSYAEYTVARASNVVPLGPGAEKLSCWFAGGTSAFGRAAINLAVQKGVHVTATTRNEGRIPGLKALGVEGVEIETPRLSERLSTKFDAILDLIGNSTIVDSLKMVHRGGRVCLAGFLGGLAPVPDFNPLLQMASGVHFSFFGSFVFGTPEFPLSDVPLQEIVEIVAEGKFEAEPSRVFMFEEIQEAHRLMDANQANGKMVVVVD
ncbi:chaperonin 10-like protein [Aspergillus aurantiobrunneus]